ncbi:transcriptional regulator [Pseudomonas sp. ICMP 460]|uniref:transcriptional regulator n=1 Tax=Pseudomonas sp. ICMP 460 TaxID=1718917 RepID=UPI001179AB93|nr:transcriptional regulator [Pseudomonas sp. ICMP 460]
MRLLIACVGTLLLVLTGCSVIERVATLMAFGDHPVYVKAAEAASIQQDLLAIQQPDRVTPAGGGASQCFDYTLRNKSKTRSFYVAFTETAGVSAYGFSKCAKT